MKIKSAKAYQAVEFAGKLETFFSDRPHMAGVELSVLEGLGIKITSPKDSIVVPFTNVAYFKFELSENDKKTKGREPKSSEGSGPRGR